MKIEVYKLRHYAVDKVYLKIYSSTLQVLYYTEEY